MSETLEEADRNTQLPRQLSCDTGKPEQRSGIIAILLASTFVTLILYRLFFVFADLIWGTNTAVAPADVTPAVRIFLPQHDGIESYVLYLFSFLTILSSYFGVRFYEHLNLDRKNRFDLVVKYASLTFFLFCAGLFFLSVKFVPPMMEVTDTGGLVLLCILVLTIMWALLRIASWKTHVADAIIVLALLPVCFIAVSPISAMDYSYIFAPALRLINHVRIADIYFQYDLFLSILAAIWMKLNIDLNFFQVLGQFSYFGFFVAIFFFSKTLFINKKLPYYFLTSLVLIKIYGLIHDSVLVFQVTPLRLDLWIVILIVAYKKGIFSKTLVVILGAMIVFDKTFGLIYLGAYLEAIFVLLMLSASKQIFSKQHLKSVFMKCMLLSRANMLIIAISFLISFLMFKGVSYESAAAYQKIGIGFMQISRNSFYWYFFVLLGLTFVLLMRRRHELKEKYFVTGLFLTFLAIGNSLYFFGRSHENNIINVAGSLVFVLFLAIDLIGQGASRDAPDFWTSSRRKAVLAMPAIFLLLVTYSYSNRIIPKIKTQMSNALDTQFIYPMTESYDTSTIKRLTANSEKVYFACNNDFYYYYYGGYVPPGHYSPYYSWIFKQDVVNFLQGLLEDDYYIVAPDQDFKNEAEILTALKYRNTIKQDGFVVISN